jgi:hypothetical protein
MFFKKNPKSTLLYLLAATALAAWLLWALPSSCKSEAPPPEEKTTAHFHEILGMKETCMNCHADYTGFVPNHDPRNIGCTPCHLGNPYAEEEKASHEGMVLVPGNLSDVHRTCGASNCHHDIVPRIENSLMTSMAGVITVNRFTFGESETLSAWAHVKDLHKDHPADVHLRHLCASCHLGNEKTKPAPVSESSRGGGCIACHLDYSQAADFQKNKAPEGRKFHPAINLRVTNDHCFGCHSRSGRISTNYEGWHETKLDAGTYANRPSYRLLADGRIFQKMKPDVHRMAGLNCIDCHSAKEVMGDGKRYLHSEEAVKVRCQDCHFTEKPATIGYDDLDNESKKILYLRKQNLFDARFVVGSESAEALVNVIFDENDQPVMWGKNSGKRHPLKPAATACSRGKAHDALTCSACHTEWAPQCVGCHNSFDKNEMAYDLLDKQQTQGKWVEYLGEFFAERPTLGVVDADRLRQIKPFVPGMIMTTDMSGFPGHEQSPEIFHRLFAPVAPHTTNREGRSCESCHNDPLALGYGRGVLKYETAGGKGRWHFTPEYENSPQDGLPLDAWIGFLKKPSGTQATRPNARPFNVAEQQRILRVGACLTCHRGDSEVMLRGLKDFEKTLREVSGKCVLPVF